MAFYFKIQLQDIIEPEVWRRIVVPDHITMLQFHEVIQAAFGWKNIHLFEFVNEWWQLNPIGVPNEVEPGVQDASCLLLNSVFKKKGDVILYTYDFGDNWEHVVTLEKITPEKIKKADYIDGQGTCPPEDCGGSLGYEDVKKSLAATCNPEYNELKKWMGLRYGVTWSPHIFDLKVCRKQVRDAL